MREISLDNNDIEYLLFLRNPTGNLYNKDDEVWQGDWSPLSSKWTPRTRRQCNYYVTEKKILEAKQRGRAELRAFKTEANKPSVKMAAKKTKKKKVASEVSEQQASEQESGSEKEESKKPESAATRSKASRASKSKASASKASASKASGSRSGSQSNRSNNSQTGSQNSEAGSGTNESKNDGTASNASNSNEESSQKSSGSSQEEDKEGGDSEAEWILAGEEPVFGYSSDTSSCLFEGGAKKKKKKKRQGHGAGNDEEGMAEPQANEKPEEEEKKQVTGDDGMTAEERKQRKKERREQKMNAYLEKVAAQSQNHDYSESNARGSTFWMSLKDFSRYFYIVTVSYSNVYHKKSFCSDQVFSFKWGACQFTIPNMDKNCFLSLFQLNDRFMDEEGGDENYEYAEMQLIVTKIIKNPQKRGAKECAFIDGATSDLYNSVHVRINKMTPGTYIVFYTADFNKDQLCRRLNVILQSSDQVEMKRLSARKFGLAFLNDLERRNFKRSVKEDYVQPVL